MNHLRECNRSLLKDNLEFGIVTYLFIDPYGELWVDIKGDWKVKFPNDKLCFIIKPKKKNGI